MKIKIISIIIALCVLIAALSGFQLKKPEGESKSTLGDRLIGTIITTESLNTFDMEEYLNENIGNIVKDKNHTVNIEDKQNYMGKIYARQVVKEDTTKDGEKITHKEYVFDDIDGYWIFDAKIPSTETEESYTCLCSEGGLSNIQSKVHHTDNGIEEIELTADIYYSYEKWGTVFYMNPVYQEGDGDIYCVEGMGHSVTGDKGSVGSDSVGAMTSVAWVFSGSVKDGAVGTEICGFPSALPRLTATTKAATTNTAKTAISMYSSFFKAIFSSFLGFLYYTPILPKRKGENGAMLSFLFHLAFYPVACYNVANIKGGFYPHDQIPAPFNFAFICGAGCFDHRCRRFGRRQG